MHLTSNALFSLRGMVWFRWKQKTSTASWKLRICLVSWRLCCRRRRETMQWQMGLWALPTRHWEWRLSWGHSSRSPFRWPSGEQARTPLGDGSFQLPQGTSTSWDHPRKENSWESRLSLVFEAEQAGWKLKNKFHKIGLFKLDGILLSVPFPHTFRSRI